MKLEDQTLKALITSLKFREMRQNLIQSNIANENTPGYKAKRLDFEAALARAIDLENQETMNTTDDRHFNVGAGSFENLEPEIYDDPNGVVQVNGNTVDRDDELAKMAENKIRYDQTVQLINKKFGLMRYIVSEQ